MGTARERGILRPGRSERWGGTTRGEFQLARGGVGAVFVRSVGGGSFRVVARGW